MRRLVIALSLILLLAMFPARAQSPQITTFTTSFESVGREALAARTVRVPVSWTTSDRPLVSNLVFEQILPNGSTVNVELPRLIPYVASSGDGIAAPILPDGSVDRIRLRVSLVHLFDGTIYDTAEFSLSIVSGNTGGTGTGAMPTLTSFIVDYGAGVDPQRLAAGAVRLPVSWTAINRPITANLVFEQILSDGSTVNVELPRDVLWVNSSDVGVVAPISPGGDASELVLRLRLIDLLFGRTYDQRSVHVPVRSASPVIRDFSTRANNVSATSLMNGTASIDVHWIVENRPPGTNLVFEQVLPDGRVRNAELPRSFVIVSSSGDGVVYLTGPADVDVVTVQMRLVDLNSNTSLTSARLNVPVIRDGQPDSSIEIREFNVSPVFLGQHTTELTVSWAVRNADTVRLMVNTTNYPDLAASGSLTIDVADLNINRSPFPVLLAASNMENETASASVNVTLEGGTTIDVFSAKPLSVVVGEEITFTWEISGAFREAYITWPPTGPQNIFQRVTTITENSGTFATPALDLWEGDQLFILVVDVTGQEQIRSSATVQITGEGCEFVWAFEIDEARCPLSEAHVVDGAFQTFDGGMMLWVSVGEPTIYVLFDDGRAARYPDTWNGSEYTIEGEPPAGKVAPQRGFGFLWSADATLQNDLGWATAPEQGYNVTWQPADSIERWYMTLPDERAVRVDASGGGSWQFAE